MSKEVTESRYLWIGGYSFEFIIEDQLLSILFRKEYFFQPTAAKGRVIGSLRITSKTTSYVFKFNSKRNTIHVTFPVQTDFESIDFVTRAFLQLICLEFGILLLHASSFLSDQGAFIFIGPSGAGKSTIIAKVPAHKILSNDTAVIKKSSGKYYAYFSPFDKPIVKRFRRNKFRACGIFSLVKNSKAVVKKLPIGEKFKEVLHNTIFGEHLKKNPVNRYKRFFKSEYEIPSKRLLDLYYTALLKVVAAIPMYRFYFPKNLSVVKFFQKHDY